MRTAWIAAALALALAMPAQAQRQGAYDVEGRGGDGQAYSGTAMLENTGRNTWRVTWQVGPDTAQGVGLLIPEGPLFVVGYVMVGREIGVVAYAVEPDGRLRGTWAQGQGGSVGHETLTPASGAARK